MINCYLRHLMTHHPSMNEQQINPHQLHHYCCRGQPVEKMFQQKDRKMVKDPQLVVVSV